MLLKSLMVVLFTVPVFKSLTKMSHLLFVSQAVKYNFKLLFENEGFAVEKNHLKIICLVLAICYFFL